MRDDYFGICTVKNNAFAMSLPPLASAALPVDFVGDFVEPLRANDCCVVIRKDNYSHKEAPPRRCRGPVQAPKVKGGSANLCCKMHAKHEQAARAWSKGKVGT